MRNLGAKAALICATTVVGVTVFATVAFAAPVLPAGTTSGPHNSRGTCTGCHTYAKPAPAPAPAPKPVPPVVTPPVVTPPVVTPPVVTPPVVTPPVVVTKPVKDDDEHENADAPRKASKHESHRKSHKKHSRHND